MLQGHQRLGCRGKQMQKTSLRKYQLTSSHTACLQREARLKGFLGLQPSWHLHVMKQIVEIKMKRCPPFGLQAEIAGFKRASTASFLVCQIACSMTSNPCHFGEPAELIFQRPVVPPKILGAKPSK